MNRKSSFFLSILIILCISICSILYFYNNDDINSKSNDYLYGYSNFINKQSKVSKVYIILVDGLRYDKVMPNMENAVRLIYDKKACLLKARFDGPSNSRPGYARIFTGSPNNINKIWRNDQKSLCTVPSIFEIAKKNNLKTACSSYFWVGQLFNKDYVTDKLNADTSQSIQYTYLYSNEKEKDSKVFDMAANIIRDHNPNICLIHPMEVDISGHRYGSISTAYDKSVSNTDILIEEFLKSVDLKDTLVMIISDHGHRDGGGHGGKSSSEVDVPIILIGDMVKGGIYDIVVSQEDIAPTICAVLDIPFSDYMTGTIIDFPIKNGRTIFMGRNNRLFFNP